MTDSGLCIYHLFVWSNLNFLHNSQWINFPNQCLVLFSLGANSLHSLIMWLIISSQSPHSLHQLFSCVLFIIIMIIIIISCSSSSSILFSCFLVFHRNLPLIFRFSSCFPKPLEAVPSAPTTIGITVTFMFHFYFLFSSKVRVFVYLSDCFDFHSLVRWNGKILEGKLSFLIFLSFFFFFFFNLILVGIRWFALSQ